MAFTEPPSSPRPRRPECKIAWTVLWLVGCVSVLAGACSSTAAAPSGVAPPALAPNGSTSSTVSTGSVAPTVPVPVTLPPPPASLVAAPYDNTLAARACTLLDPAEIQAQFVSPVEAGVPIYPYCWWRVGDNGFASLTIFDKQPLATFRAYSGLNVGDVADVGETAFFASNKTLYFQVGGSSYVMAFERGAEWVDSNRPKLIALAHDVLDRLGFVPPPKLTTTTTTDPGLVNPDDPPPPPTTRPPSTTTTTRPRPPLLAPRAATARPTTPIDVRRSITAATPLRIWAGGDSIAAGPAWAVGEAAKATGLATVDTEFQVGTGLSRPDFFDWYRHLAAVADARDPEVMILIFGGNDIQPLVLPDGRSVTYGDAEWLGEYQRRVAQIMDTLAVRGRRVIWVGTPPMETPTYNDQMAALNQIYSTVATAHTPWAGYFDAWTMFSPTGEPGVFTAELPDANGVAQRVRIDDIHYNVYGSEVLAAALVARIRTFATI